MLRSELKIGSRTSALALKQVAEVTDALSRIEPNLRTTVIGINTFGDKDKTTPISAIEGTDFFTREIDMALLNGEVDLAVHSAKDLSETIPRGLIVAAITKSVDPYDALVAKEKVSLNQLPKGAKIGTSSRRRHEQLRAFRHDFQLVNIRGTIEERLAQLATTDLAAIVIAACALVRLGWEDRITERLPLDILTPHPLQGSLAIVTREKDMELRKYLQVLNGQ